MELVYKKIEEKDKEQLFKLIDTVLSGLPDPSHFIPYEQWELDSMFDEVNYAPLYGAYDGDKSFAKIRIEQQNAICAIFPDYNIIVVTSSGKYYQSQLDPKKGGTCHIIKT